MATGVQVLQEPWSRPPEEKEEEEEEDLDSDEFEADECDSEDDCDEDPTFYVLEETRTRLSSMSLKKTWPRVLKNDGSDEELCVVEVPQLDVVDEKCFQNVERLIKDGKLNQLKVDQCKVYLRKYGLRLSGKKDVLIGRIREHLEISDGAGEKKYPISSFVINCQGDACTGDVLMFEQKVYEMYNAASRSAIGPPCGTRIVVGRVVKESYGAAKQQHTFTIEVLWSKGVKSLPPLHPLLIKGRNLYRLKTVRQKWIDEEERRKVLREKHARGSVARHSRDIRVKVKEMKKNQGKRVNEGRGNNNFMPEHMAQLHPSHKPLEYQLQHPNHMTCAANQNTHLQNCPTFAVKQFATEEPQNSVSQAIDKRLLINLPREPSKPIVYGFPSPNHGCSQREPSKPIVYGFPSPNHGCSQREPSKPIVYAFPSPNHGCSQREPSKPIVYTFPSPNHGCSQREPSKGLQSPQRKLNTQPPENVINLNRPPLNSISHGVHIQPARNLQAPQYSGNGYFSNPPTRDQSTSRPVLIMGYPHRYPPQRQICRYYRQGRCYYMENCKFLHE